MRKKQPGEEGSITERSAQNEKEVKDVTVRTEQSGRDRNWRQLNLFLNH